MLRFASKIRRPRFVHILVGLLLIMVLAPAVQQLARPGMSRMLAVLGLVIPVLAMTAAGDKGRARHVAIGMALLCVLTNADAVAEFSHLPPQIGIALCTCFLAYTTLRLLVGVVRSRTVTADVIAGALSSYMMVGLTWAFAYGLLETVRPGSIHGLSEGSTPLNFPTLLYFSYITLLSIGFGDITPLSATARMMTVLEGLIGMAFTTIILAVLVAAYLTRRNDADRPTG
jgi:hypothetical protein